MSEAEEYLKEKFGVNESYDVGILHTHLYEFPVLLVYINGLVDGLVLTELLTNVQDNNWHTDLDENRVMEHYFPYHAITEYDSKEKWLAALLSGQVTFILKNGSVYTIDVRSYPGRQPEEPDNEKVVRGSRDGFTENIVQNTALIRRRIRDTDLRFELHQVSNLGQTDIAITFIKGIANEDNLGQIRDRLKQINHDGFTMTDKALEEWLFKQGFHPLPFVRFTERPDIAAAHLLEGHIVIVVDTSPSVIIVPTTLFHHLQHAEEYRQAPIIGTVARQLRYLGVLLSLFLLPLWYLFAKHPEFLPKALEFLGPKKLSEIPLLLQILFADVGIEFLRLAAIHTPTPLSTAMGIIAALVIGQMAVDVGLFIPEVILYTAITAIFTFAIPSYELSITTKIFRLFILLSTAIFGVNGFFIALVILFWYVCSVKPLNVPYLWPVVPFFPKAFLRIFIRFPMPADAKRPFITRAPVRKRS
ncbi:MULTISPECIES: spore germination protein [Bacillaceae]|uniref:spore germination protein n=1 Tax=Bacillaceae TaxID=186817 RepID=UPI0006AE249D|nr:MULTISPECIES: spore germination protein [Bacillaceae]ALC85894.1 stage V sporulation protein AF [Bacillus sp. FJAT-22090]KQL35639.1 stage V sporulation protein AF [Psychrobacillus sp. FJAT-21963]MDF2066152.1 spore germination protein [Bacillus sp. Cr_A10]